MAAGSYEREYLVTRHRDQYFINYYRRGHMYDGHSCTPSDHLDTPKGYWPTHEFRPGQH
ncbi:hypothetical protein PISMIDRAFT_686134 [Pisolithus microcarpus 441]|uniref:Uncharacterized protein n=1 Tax=Pisolithus microcarpus 441 TaxID=765257 RepID=A0A0C9YRZ0_9AGAM|nr:hypothetical protein PISMIDRAFT_686134 [Pisolithus microcarpus 441]